MNYPVHLEVTHGSIRVNTTCGLCRGLEYRTITLYTGQNKVLIKSPSSERTEEYRLFHVPVTLLQNDGTEEVFGTRSRYIQPELALSFRSVQDQ